MIVTRRRLYQGELWLYEASKPSTWEVRDGWKVYIKKSGYHGNPVRLKVESPQGSIRFDSLLNTEQFFEDTSSSWARITVSLDQDGESVCYCHVEDNMMAGGCILSTILCDKRNYPDDNQVLSILRDWRDNVLLSDNRSSYASMLVGQYYETAAYLAKSLQELEDNSYFEHLETMYLRPIAKLAQSGNHYEAFRKYRDLLTDIEYRLEIFNGSVINNYSQRVLCWTGEPNQHCGNQNLFYVEPGQKSHPEIDVDHIQDPSSQWWKIGWATASVNSNGSVTDAKCKTSTYNKPCGE
jgi:hypothetical protein